MPAGWESTCSQADPSPYSSVAFVLIGYHMTMAVIKAEEIQIPRRAREAVAHHEEVIVFNLRGQGRTSSNRAFR